jgi:hypothetical protein
MVIATTPGSEYTKSLSTGDMGTPFFITRSARRKSRLPATIITVKDIIPKKNGDIIWLRTNRSRMNLSKTDERN